MKRSRLSYDEWKCIVSKEVSGKRVYTDFFEGYLGLIDIKQVSEAQKWKFHGEDIVVCDNGFKWLSILPENDFYCITAMMTNEKFESKAFQTIESTFAKVDKACKNNIQVWYIDMIADQGTDADGVPYFDDLYLDLVVYPNGEIIVDDMDELEEALRRKDITQEQFGLAINTAEKLKSGLLSDIQAFISYTKKCYETLFPTVH